jgi:hypothetical protein
VSRTHCKRAGHEMTPENTRRDGHCRQCGLDLAAARSAKMTHCRNGHELTPENRDKRGHCKACRVGRLERVLESRLARLAAGVVEMRCDNGHDLTLLGAVNPKGRCRECANAASKRYQDRKKRSGQRPTPTIVCGRKFCSCCGRWKHLVFFPNDGRMQKTTGLPRFYGWCDTCHHAKRKAIYEGIMADPERHAAQAERQRFAAHEDRRRAGVPERNWQAPKSRSSLLPRWEDEHYPAGPFITWWRAYQAANPLLKAENFLAGAHADAAHIRRAVSGKTPVLSLDLIDKVLVQAGESPTTLLAMYPWSATEDVKASIRTLVLLPEPVPVPLRIQDAYYHPDEWTPPEGMFTPERLEALMRIRGELIAETTKSAPRNTAVNPRNVANIERQREWRAERKAA